MIMIKEQWYDVRDLGDVVKLVREEFNCDLADKIEELVDELKSGYESDVENVRDVLDRTNDEIDALESENEDLRDEIDELNETIERLNEEIEDMKENVYEENDEI